MPIPAHIRNYNATVDGVGYAGRVVMAKPPAVKLKTEEHRGGGMDAPMDVDLGMEKPECELEFAEHAPEIYRQFGLVTGADVGLTLRAAAQRDGEPAFPIVWTLRGIYTELEAGELKAGEKGSLKSKLTLRYTKLSINGQDVMEIDVLNMKRIVGGNDVLASQRAALGL